jgi:hypothetical protein
MYVNLYIKMMVRKESTLVYMSKVKFYSIIYTVSIFNIHM